MYRVMPLLFCSILCACQFLNIKLVVNAQQNINPDRHNRPLAVMLRVYLLSGDKAFRSASYEQLWQADHHVLDKDLIGRKDWIIKPNAKQTLLIKPDKRAKYIAVIALFRNPTLGRWRLIKPIGDVNWRVLLPIELQLERNQLSWGQHAS